MKKYLLILLLACSTLGNAQYNLFARQNFAHKVVSAYDADAQAFITAAGLTDLTQKNAINTLVVSLKSNSLWLKMKAIYPFIGGTAFSHKWNLKDPRDLNAAFRLTFSGSITHNSNGVTFLSGSDITTNFIMSANSVINDFQYSYYCRNEISNAYLFRQSGSLQFFANVSSLLLSDMYDTTGAGPARVAVANVSSIGYFSASRLPSPIKHAVYKDGVLKASNGTTAGTLQAGNLFINDATGAAGSNCAFATLSEGLTDTEESTIYTIVQAYQTSLGRQN